MENTKVDCLGFKGEKTNLLLLSQSRKVFVLVFIYLFIYLFLFFFAPVFSSFSTAGRWKVRVMFLDLNEGRISVFVYAESMADARAVGTWRITLKHFIATIGSAPAKANFPSDPDVCCASKANTTVHTWNTEAGILCGFTHDYTHAEAMLL